MSYFVTAEQANQVLSELLKTYDVYAPKRFPKQGRFSDTDIIRYAKVTKVEEIVYDEKSDFPAKEVINPIQQAIFYFTEDEFRASKGQKKPMLLFARPCDINAQKVQARIFMENGGYEDLYYARMRELINFVLMECPGGDDTCFCCSMGTNKTDNYVMAVRFGEEGLKVEIKDEKFVPYFEGAPADDFTPKFVEENETKVTLPEIPDKDVLLALKSHPMWTEFNKRCVSCGACTVACSTCTCFTTRDIVYGQNPEIGERHRITASCQIDGFSDIAGGFGYRKTAGDRMRYKMLHKFHDYKARFGEDMCVGCGRCTSRCPAYISVTATLGKMNAAVEEIKKEQGK